MTTLQRRRCLVVDDDATIREIVALNLEAEGMTVHAADNGADAVALAMALAPEVIVLDVMMPGRSGYDVLAELKQHPQTQSIPVVLLTAKATDTDIWEGWRSGAAYYMTKPFTIDQLLYCLSTIFEGGPEPASRRPG